MVARIISHDSASDIRIHVMRNAITWRITMREIIDLNRITLVLGDEISDAANGVDLYLGTLVGQLLAQAVDIDLDGIRGDFAGKTEDVVLDLLLRPHTSLAAHDEFEHRGYAGPKHLRLI